MPTILSSRKLSAPQARLLLNAGISYVDYEAIQINFVDFEIQNPIENAIITSQNTVRALLQKQGVIKKCFVVGEKTKALLKQQGFSVEASAHYGKDLAELIVEKYPAEKFDFFCGDKRRPEMPDILKANHVDFKETRVYENRLNPQTFDQEFDGILFFSPSQVKSYVRHNTLRTQMAFCIGTTTAAEAEKYTSKITIATQPTVESLIVRVVKTIKK